MYLSEILNMFTNSVYLKNKKVKNNKEIESSILNNQNQISFDFN